MACSSAPRVRTAAPEPPPVPSGPPRLEKGAVQEREIRGGDSHEYRISVQAGDYARISIEQEKMDVTARLAGPSGQTVLEVDGPGGDKAPELLSWIADHGGEYLLAVAPRDPGAPPALYRVELEELRPSAAGDAQRVLAERADSEAEHWWALQDEEPKRKALARFEEAAALWKAAGDLPRRVRSLNQVGALHRSLGDTARALEVCGEALALAVEIGDRAGEAEARNNLGVARHQAGQNQQAIEDLRQALRIWESLDRQEEVASSSYGLGVVQFAQGETDAALASLNRALELRQAANDPNQSIVLTAIASVHRDRGQGDVALELFRRALDLSRAAGDRRGEANALQNMASIYLRRGELQQALELFNAALELHRSLGNRNQEGQALSYLGATALYLGDNDRALEVYSRALQISRELGTKYWEAVTLRDIGWTLDRRGEPRIALEHYAQAYEIGRQLEDRRIQGAALHGMGRSQIALGSPAEAIGQLAEAVELYREIGNALFEIQALLELGRAYKALAQEARAADLFFQALDLSRQRKTLMLEAVAQFAIARLERDRGRLPEATAAIEEALHIIETVRPKVASQRLRVSFFASQREIYDFYIDLLMRRYEADGQSGHLAAALAASERARARGLLDLLAEGRIDVRRGIDPELKRREEEVANRISLLQSQLLEDLSQGSRQGARIEAELAAAEEEGERIEWQIRREHPRYAAFRHPTLLAPERIQALLDERTAFLEYAAGKEASYLFVVTRERLAGYRLPPAEEIGAEVDAIREGLQKPGRLQYGRYVAAAYRLHEALIAPAGDILRGKPRLMISPDGPLLLLSFEALLTAPAPAGSRGYESLPYLIREKSVSYVPSANVLSELGGFGDNVATASSGPGLFLGFGDPLYPQASRTEADTAAGPLGRALQEAGLPSPRRLPASRDEVLAIAGLYPPGQSRLYLDKEATEENVKNNPALKEARRIHFAVHGFLNETRPEFSGLVLALDEDPRENGLLQVYEIFNLELSADLVVLSACDTALGKNVGGEGLLGVSRALLYAGAASVVVSLWQVADASTPDLMVRFYRHLNESGDKAEALRLSKLELIREGHAHPYHWAPFLLIGRPGPGVTSGRLARQ